jgi:hypothetical protein
MGATLGGILPLFGGFQQYLGNGMSWRLKIWYVVHKYDKNATQNVWLR